MAGIIFDSHFVLFQEKKQRGIRPKLVLRVESTKLLGPDPKIVAGEIVKKLFVKKETVHPPPLDLMLQSDRYPPYHPPACAGNNVLS